MDRIEIFDENNKKEIVDECNRQAKIVHDMFHRLIGSDIEYEPIKFIKYTHYADAPAKFKVNYTEEQLNVLNKLRRDNGLPEWPRI